METNTTQDLNHNGTAFDIERLEKTAHNEGKVFDLSRLSSAHADQHSKAL